MKTYVYDPKKVSLVINGHFVTGFAEGDKIKVNPVTKELYKHFCGVNGDVTYSAVHDKRRIVTFTLKSGSPSNVVLDLLKKLPTAFIIAVANKSSASYTGGSGECRIIEDPDVEFPAENRKTTYTILAPYWLGAEIADLLA